MEVGLKMASTLSEWRDKASKLNFEETELRLGLSGGGGGGGGSQQRETATNNNTTNNNNSNGKRGYSEILDLKLNISSKEKTGTDSNEKAKNLKNEKSLLTCSNYPAKPPPAKAQVVGWPPVQSFRKNVVAIRKSDSTTKDDEESINDKINTSNNNNASFVKVSMDGAPYLRKVDMKIYKSYQELSDALGKMFSSFTIGNCGSQGMMDFMNESKLMDLLNDSDFVPTYEDKDGDWMLVGDVPWEMFVKSCKRLRIMKGKEAIGLAPRAMEKCKNRS